MSTAKEWADYFKRLATGKVVPSVKTQPKNK